MLWDGFIGDTYQALSPSIAAQTAINIYAETSGAGNVKRTTFYGTPGLLLEGTVVEMGCRGLFTQDGRTWFVCGDRLYERTAPGVYVDLGEIPNDQGPVFFVSNGQGGDQLGIAGGGEINVLDLITGTLTPAVLPFAGPVMLTFIDGYTLANQADSPIVWFSALEDMTDWDGLDFFTRSGTSDNVIGIGVRRDRIKVFGSKTTTDFYDSGDADTPFLPYPSTTTQIGLVSPSLLGFYGDVFTWVGRTAKGMARVVADSDGTAVTISTPPIEAWLAGCTTLADAAQITYEQGGHQFFVLTCPGSPDAVQTYHYDARESALRQTAIWQARAGWNAVGGVYTRWRAQASTSIDDLILVGDYANGNIYTLDLGTYADNGEILRRERAAPYLSEENQWLFVSQIELGMQPGVGLTTGQGSAPVANLEISKDGARTWVNVGTATLGAMGEYEARAIWRALRCRARADRFVARVTQTDPVKCVWGPGLWLTVEQGTGQL